MCLCAIWGVIKSSVVRLLGLLAQLHSTGLSARAQATDFCSRYGRCVKGVLLPLRCCVSVRFGASSSRLSSVCSVCWLDFTLRDSQLVLKLLICAPVEE
ncbi:unnamed protein product [Heligmosomoides polygyrus]|uniref:Secreted protein n=1 Tax=Heligmosomoides polygyrus TaxID=6339 RepID=A0A3P8EB31_HELPZ|nr:unnamed protein product [Heligmosomoides polygyrus]